MGLGNNNRQDGNRREAPELIRLLSKDEIIELAIQDALTHARQHGLKRGDVVARKQEERCAVVMEVKGTSIKVKLPSEGSSDPKAKGQVARWEVSETFDVNLVRQFAQERTMAQSLRFASTE